ncbi:hypothetical protein LWI28_024557 [Acer negundo]|uniref:Uncharacterized protein n=1 Tax=Acer negundo TaxID=4023 RepID=A0AAD5IBT3_ACENE|nr:hypothetical protein LWI28_024557 [Acer negundo]KAK4834931.1 hypothetical protein QYF36_002703 [Acer negundo]
MAAMLKKHFLLFVLVLLIIFAEFDQLPSSYLVQAARPTLLNHQGYSKRFASLGVVCKCCDGEKGECRSTWDSSSCPIKLQCLPWKFH